ncbi:MAG: ATP-binding protein [Eubacterium sp.]|nr:ATP-binding protein [Eubacterium sp.]MDY5113118.1 ATP-binding protein [Bilifractor sp.]
MIERKQYLNRMIALKDKKIIKILTGVRRCGKSTMLSLYKRYLLSHGVEERCIHFINFEDLQFEPLQEYHRLHDAIVNMLVPDKMNYIMLDEVQMVPDFQKAVDSLFLRDNVDLYLTGSNAYLLSGELATLLSGRYVEIAMLPFSFREFYQVIGGDPNAAFQTYFWKGGLPYGIQLSDEHAWMEYMNGIYNTVILKDVVARQKIADIDLLTRLIRFLADNIGNIVSSNKIANTLSSSGRRTTAATIDNYIRAFKEALLLYEANRYDVRGKQRLKSLGKFYLADPGFRTVSIGKSTSDIGHVLENIIYLELIRREFQVYIGKMDALEVDFVARKGDEIIYYQVAASIMDKNTFDREFAPLRQIKDNYPKYVITLDTLPISENGIRQINAIDFLLQET